VQGKKCRASSPRRAVAGFRGWHTAFRRCFSSSNSCCAFHLVRCVCLSLCESARARAYLPRRLPWEAMLFLVEFFPPSRHECLCVRARARAYCVALCD